MKKKAKKKAGAKAIKSIRARAKVSSAGIRLTKELKDKLALMRKRGAEMRVALDQLREAEGQK